MESSDWLPGSPLDVFDFLTDPVLKTCKGRDKLCSFLQNFAKWSSLVRHQQGTPGWQLWRNVENSMSSGRKIFRFVKYLPESTKSFHAFKRALAPGSSSPDALRSFTEGCARALSCAYFWFDNIVWAQGVGMISLPSLRVVKSRKNTASLARLLVALLGEVIYFFTVSLSRRLSDKPVSPLMAHLDATEHALVAVSTLCNIRMTLPRLFQGFGCSQPAIGLLGMTSSLAVLGTLWVRFLRSKISRRQVKPPSTPSKRQPAILGYATGEVGFASPSEKAAAAAKEAAAKAAKQKPMDDASLAARERKARENQQSWKEKNFEEMVRESSKSPPVRRSTSRSPRKSISPPTTKPSSSRPWLDS